jgi:DNA-directed RNA polymerase subunit H (RpoH/RPB5)
MESRIPEYREFFEEVLSTFATLEELPERDELASAEDKARWELEGKTLADLEYTPEDLPRVIASDSAAELLKLRRTVAMGIVMGVVRGRTHEEFEAETLRDALHDLGLMDAEIARRHLDRFSSPPKSPDDTPDNS